jgi:hypothetical protein
LLAVDQRQRRTRLVRREPVLDHPLADYREGTHRRVDALERPRSEILEVEHAADQAPGGVGDDHAAGLGQDLQPRGQVRRIADDDLLAGGTLPDEAADHDQAGRDPDARRERLPGRRQEPANSTGDRQTRPHGALGVVLVRAGPAEAG